MTTEELNTIVEAVVAELEKNGVDFDNEVKEAQDTDLVFVIRETDSGYGGFKVTWKGLLDIITAKATQAKNDAVTAKNAANTILEQVTSKESNVSSMESNVHQMGVAVETLKKQTENLTETAIQANTGAVTAKDAAAEILTQVTSKESNVSSMESNVSEMKSSVETTKGQVETLKGQAKTAQQGAERARDTAEDYMKSAQQSAETSASNIERLENVDFRQKSLGKAILDINFTETMKELMDNLEEEPNEAIALTLEPDVPTADTHNFGVRGQICIDSNYLYVCTALNTWKKISLLDL